MLLFTPHDCTLKYKLIVRLSEKCQKFRITRVGDIFILRVHEPIWFLPCAAGFQIRLSSSSSSWQWKLKNLLFHVPDLHEICTEGPSRYLKKNFQKNFLPSGVPPGGQFWTFFRKTSFFNQISPNLDRRTHLVDEMNFW